MVGARHNGSRRRDRRTARRRVQQAPFFKSRQPHLLRRYRDSNRAEYLQYHLQRGDRAVIFKVTRSGPQ